MAKLSQAIAAAGLLLMGLGHAATHTEPFTPLHEAGRCAMRGHCGSKSFFGKELPCSDNDPAEEPDQKLRDLLVETCGPKWNSGPVCCNLDQVRDREAVGRGAGQLDGPRKTPFNDPTRPTRCRMACLRRG